MVPEPRRVAAKGSERKIVILILGKTGQLSRSLSEVFAHAQIDYRCVGRDELDFSKDEQTFLRNLEIITSPSVATVINAVAYTQVDKAEDETTLANRVNGDSPGWVAKMCAAKNIRFIHFSTDYVFDGEGLDPKNETSPKQPLNAYGQSKLLGEQLVMAANPASLVLRISWVYSPYGTNFLKTILRLAKERQSLKVIHDQIGSPMSAVDIADLILTLVNSGPYQRQEIKGVFNLSSKPFVSWNEFAKLIVATAKAQNMRLQATEIEEITSEQFATKAKRPKNSRMDDSLFFNTTGLRLPSWQRGLDSVVRRVYES